MKQDFFQDQECCLNTETNSLFICLSWRRLETKTVISRTPVVANQLQAVSTVKRSTYG